MADFQLPNGISPKEFSRFFDGQPVRKVFLFGSYARGEATDDSDIDLVVELDQTAILTGLEYFLLWDEIEKLTGKKVDLISKKGLSRHILPKFEKEKILIYTDLSGDSPPRNK